MRTSKEVNMKGNKLCFYLFAAFMIIALVAFSSGTSEAQAAGEVTTRQEALAYISHLLTHRQEIPPNKSP